MERQERRTTWPGTALLDQTALVLTGRVCPGSIEMLKTSVNDLYAWQQPYRPEDLAFYRPSGEVLLESIAHDEEAILFPSETEVEEFRALLPQLAGVGHKAQNHEDTFPLDAM